MWCRWKARQSLHEIGRTLGKNHVVIVEDGQIPYRPEMLAKKPISKSGAL
jgi:hypothetical protein